MSAAMPASPPAREGVLHPDQVLVLFDGRCGFCSRCAAWALRFDWRRKTLWLPNQTPGLAAAVDLSDTEAAAAAWAILPTGARRPGAAAVAAVADAWLPGGLPLVSAVYHLPGLRFLADRLYAWVAANRGRFPGTPVCTIGPPPPLDDAVRWEIERRLARGEVLGAGA